MTQAADPLIRQAIPRIADKKFRPRRNDTQPRGRFAPSPTGPLHMGSLLTAVASYLDIKYQRGLWCVRIDDIDPPRAAPGAVEQILTALDKHALVSDEPVDYQSTHERRYTEAFSRLRPQTFFCRCSRRSLASHAAYPGTCRGYVSERDDAAVRIQVGNASVNWHDAMFGVQHADLTAAPGDFVIKRRDGLWAYVLATAVDDACDYTQVVRGFDLLDTTAPQIFLMMCLGLPVPQYMHVPLLRFPGGDKLSKQTHAPALDNNRAPDNLRTVLEILGQAPPQQPDWDCTTWLRWGIANWRRESIPKALPAWRD